MGTMSVLQIRPEQMDVLRLIDKRRTIEKLITFLQHYQCLPAGGDMLQRKQINQWMDRAHAYELLTEADITTFLVLSSVLGNAFETLPKHLWAKTILTDFKKQGFLKGMQLRKHCKPYVDSKALVVFEKMETDSTG